MYVEPIGGYFELELRKSNNLFSKNQFILNSGRHAFEFILSCIEDINVLYLPFYTCDVVLHPLKRLGVNYKFYSINEKLELDEDLIRKLGDNDYLVINNFFGIKDTYIDSLIIAHYDKVDRFIVDCAQSFFYKNSNINYLFYSPRKFVGVPDGGVAIINNNLEKYSKKFLELNQNCSLAKFSHLLKRIELGPEAGYNDFHESSRLIAGEVVERMSFLTEKLLHSVDFVYVKSKRRDNFKILQDSLVDLNQFKFLAESNFECALYYPLLLSDSGSNLRDFLIKNKVFCPTFWPNVLNSLESNMLEYRFAKNIVFIPIDQRYSVLDMTRIIELIKSYVGK